MYLTSDIKKDLINVDHRRLVNYKRAVNYLSLECENNFSNLTAYCFSFSFVNITIIEGKRKEKKKKRLKPEIKKKEKKKTKT